ncbi:MAG: hypothetical protein BWY08_01278 [Bacteroidetes bacterium ADurb.Bin174]|nr:MAG: hypothetical protein BWY08_01278 [Bacteroidetes bacterium ADurb.Bin174]
MATLDFKDTILQFAERISKLKDSIGTEEATKNAFVMPMINALGYDVFNPLEVIPEFTCDIGTKKGEKIDYAIMKDGKPIMLIECKHWQQPLSLQHDNQLLRYFHVSDARFGVLTNGIEYRFYTDIDKNNVMDEKPFLVIDMQKLSDAKIEQLKSFHKSYFNENEILSTAAELKISNELKNIVKNEFSEPSNEFVRFFVKAINGSYTAKQVEQYTPLVKRSIQNHINDVISDRLNVAMENNKNARLEKEKTPTKTEELPEGAISVSEDGKVVTIQEEIDAYNIIRSILRKHIDAAQITYTDYQSYFVVQINDNSWYWVCRINIGKRKKQIGFPKENYKGCEWIQIETIDDIFKYENNLIEALNLSLSFIK